MDAPINRHCPAIASSVLFLLMAGPLAGQTGKDTDSGEKIYQRTLRSTVWVVVPVENRRARMGSGSLIDAHRQLILTNYHVVGNKDQVLVYFPIFQKGKLVAERNAYMQGGGKPIHGHVRVKDSKRDLAVIQLDALPPDAKPLKLANDSPSPGQRIHSIGNPGASGALWVYTPGSVRQVYHQKFRTSGSDGENGFEVDARIVETASAVNSGDSGGPVVNDKGELVAVVQGHLEEAKARAYSIFIDVSEVRELLHDHHLTKIPPPPREEKPKEVQATSDKLKDKPEEDSSAKKEAEAARQLKYVQAYIDDGKKQLARKRCNEIITKYPNTKAAKEAKQLLEKLEE
jgi:S1-C subfamily serine protease